MSESLGADVRMRFKVRPAESGDFIAFRDALTGADYEVKVHPWINAEDLVGTLCRHWNDGKPGEFLDVIVEPQASLRVGKPYTMYALDETQDGRLVKGEPISVGKIAYGSLLAKGQTGKPGPSFEQ